MTRWQYRSYQFEPGDKVVEILNRLGAEGWEAFHFSKNGGQSTRVLLKRPLEVTTGEPSK